MWTAQVGGGKATLAGQQESFSDKMNSAAGYEDGSEEEEPYEREFYDDEDDDIDDTKCVDPCDDSVLKEELHRKHIHEVESYDDLVVGEEECVTNPCALRVFKMERNEQELKQAQKMCNNIKENEIPAAKEIGTKPFKKRLVKFADDVSCYTYSTENFASAKLEKRKAQFDDQDKHLHKKQEHTPPSFPRDGSKLKEVDNTNLYVGNLPASVASHKLIEMFLPFGRIVRSRVVDDCFTGLSQGYGFVKYSDPHCAAEAIKRMNGRLVEGKALEVRVAGFPSSGSNPSIHAVPEDDNQPSKETNMTKLYVCNLSLSMNTDRLIDLFLPFGEVTSAKVARDHTTGLSKGYGFVQYSSSHHAAEAVIHLNGRLVEGRKIEVRVSGIPPKQPNSAVESPITTRTIKEIDMSNLYVCNMPSSIDTKKLVELFLPFGKITHARVMADPDTFSSKGYGFIKFTDSESAAKAIAAMNGTMVGGEMMAVRVARLSPSASSSAVQTSAEINKSKLYITNIPRSMTADTLINLFAPFGQISKVLMNLEYSLVWYADVPSATKAVEHMDGYLVEGKRLVVKGAEPIPTNFPESAFPQTGGKTKEIDMANLYVGRVPSSVTEDQLIDLFRPFGWIVQARMFPFSGYGMVRYDNPSSAAAAIDHLDGYRIGGSILTVRVAWLSAESIAATSAPTPWMPSNEQRQFDMTNAVESAFPQPGGKTKEIDMANLYVGRVPSSVTEDQLFDLFRPFGRVVQSRMFRHQGHGMVRYDNPSCAAAAIDHLDGYRIGGSILNVRVAGLPAESNAAPNAPTPWMPSNEQRQIDMNNLYVCHLPRYINTERLIDIFLPCGQITQAKVVVDRYTGVSKGFGFVRFADPYSAAVALTHMNGYPLDGHVLEVRIAGVQPAAMSSYMAHFYSHFTVHDPAKAAVGIPTSYWPYYYDESTYNTVSEIQGQGTTTSATDASAQTSQKEQLPGSKSGDLVAEKDYSSQSQSAAWAGPPGFEPHAVSKKYAAGSNASQACSKDHLAQSGDGHKRSSIV
uniref:RRM domain-containing protein n=1 Tax=Oryza brachyantha TaxID=4533 RepID=J3M2S1_ORYBR